MAKNSTINLRVDSEVKEEAGEILMSLGLTLSQAFNLLLHQVRLVRGLPFEVRQHTPPESIVFNNSQDLYEKLNVGREQIRQRQVIDANLVMERLGEKYDLRR
ncbi:MAG: type II toxin-antitoxin system RelB/DinJ family antitoxin [Oscillospiraceae bacterium]|nr:type II toxin-antitoxin system RelB/DinJ family antitoxin [Oscillospiraceae bacterium]